MVTNYARYVKYLYNYLGHFMTFSPAGVATLLVLQRSSRGHKFRLGWLMIVAAFFTST
jgi:hypothetical protein